MPIGALVKFVRPPKPATVIVLDTVDGPPGDHTLEQFWHLDSTEDAARFSFSAPAEVADVWRSRAVGSPLPIPLRAAAL